MAAGRLPEPGTEYGPCAEECLHLDCAATRNDAEKQCRICSKPIGYDTRFYSEANAPRQLVHADCAEREVENERKARTA